MSLWTRWTDGEREAPEPLEGPVVATVVVGTVIWFLLFVGQLPFYGWFADHGHAWWVWTCGAGAGLGLVGLWYVRRREAAIRRGAATPPASETPEPPAGGSEPPAGAVRAAAPSSRPDGHPAR
jgi:uncharacterized protein DUF2530